MQHRVHIDLGAGQDRTQFHRGGDTTTQVNAAEHGLPRFVRRLASYAPQGTACAAGHNGHTGRAAPPATRRNC